MQETTYRVSVSIVTALTDPKGAIGRCASFSKVPSHDLWLPELWDEGYYSHRHRGKSIFESLIWAPENYSLGIDQGDEIAAHSAASRPRLGIDLTQVLAISAGRVFGEWHAPDGSLALQSQVWGGWRPDRDQPECRHHDDGEILWASKGWLEATLAQLNKRLVYTVRFQKYESSRDYDRSNGVKSVSVGLRTEQGQVRLWSAEKANLQD